MADNSYRTPTPGPLGDKPYGGDWNAGTTTRPLVLYSEAGAIVAYLFVTSGKLYGKFSATAPANSTDGTVIGTQS